MRHHWRASDIGRRTPTLALAFLLLGWPVLSGGCPVEEQPSGGDGNGGAGLSGGDESGDPATGDDGDGLDVDFTVCSADDCGPAMGMPNWVCADGSLGGPDCQPLDDGSCGWMVVECADGDTGDDGNDGGGGVVCDEDACGPAPEAPNRICDDGTIGGPICGLAADGTCGWTIRDCPGDGDVCAPSGGAPDPDGNCGGGGGDGGSCTPDQCDPAMGMPNWVCDDGTVGGPFCEPLADGNCGWVVRDCPDGGGGGDGDVCEPEACGPAPGMPNWLCDDGTIGGPACVPDAAGQCGWTIVECPGGGGDDEPCPRDACGPAMGMPNWLCEDGTIGGPACLPDEAGVCGWVIVECP